ncbi:MAG: bifunctional precorrin-2 dehydrogenase/sirohydrochlorin ferrochelatase [Candidatus Gygaella obscura]|nr:bifunctional precorrin-2 dehydrogenase/sirohydrochlorin ferrochelatase [Candidatus Gygaella obscura]
MYLPLNVRLRNKKCLVVGCGKVAVRKIRSLVKAGAVVLVVSNKISSSARKIFKGVQVEFKRKMFSPLDLKGVFFVVCATDDRSLNSFVSRECRKRNILVNVVDSLDLSDVIFPAYLKQGSLVISINTSGVSPALSRKIRDGLKKYFTNEYGIILKELLAIRKKVQQEVSCLRTRKKIFKSLTDIDFFRGDNGKKSKNKLKKKIKEFYDNYAHNYVRIKS